MNRIRTIVALSLVVALATVVPVGSTPDAEAQSTIHVTPAASENATDVVSGRVVSNTNVVLDGQPHQVSEVEISSVEKGQLSGSVLVEVPGGSLPDGTTVFVSHTPQLVAGATVQLALSPSPASGLGQAVGKDLGVFSVVGGMDGAYALSPGGVAEAQAVGDFALNGARWSNFAPPVVYRINAGNSGIPQAETLVAVHRAFRVWEDDPTSGIDFEYGGTTDRRGVDLGDGQNVVSWVVPPPGTSWLAQASWMANHQGQIIEFDVQVNRNYSWADGASSGAFDIGTVVGHEVGHGIGLAHAPATSELMHSQIRSGSIKGLGPGDRSGAAYLYPAPYDGPVCNGQPVTVNLNTGQGVPTEGPDVILGTDGSDWIYALGGDDVVCGGLGIDRIFAGEGNDLVFGDGGSDRLFGQGGHDEIHGGSGADRIWGGPGNDVINGNGGQDSMWGEEGNDAIQGHWESDNIWGGPGNDRLWGAGGKDALYGGEGDDELFGGVNTDYLNGGPGFDQGNGQQGHDNPLVPGTSGCEQLEYTTSC